MLSNLPNRVVTKLGIAIKSHKNSVIVVASVKKSINFNLFGKKSIIYLDEGSISLYSETNNLLLFKFDSPFIIGLDQIFYDTEYHYITTNDNVLLYLLSHEDAIDIFDKMKLWKDIAHLISYSMRLNEHRSNNLLENRSIYHIIKTHLEMIWELPEKEREKISVFDYILKRHKISRSSIAKIIKELNNGNYITTKRGVLINLNRLPAKF
ncbi:helix-turn-helix domain-containing protein [Citrobacter portucalensis]|uniref:Helix-turn-helix domain-containing protein n=1 Tax=Citrobacter portucalensis TaxID=1639133 RepID=A0AAW5W8P7_9ENTR|nr:helix-turn-helix domain-containing protein [Citrobacter portucalensis]MCX9004405.1 helix-turn-helix domain-containing protein [Citrobacter portucalensis]